MGAAREQTLPRLFGRNQLPIVKHQTQVANATQQRMRGKNGTAFHPPNCCATESETVLLVAPAFHKRRAASVCSCEDSFSDCAMSLICTYDNHSTRICIPEIACLAAAFIS